MSDSRLSILQVSTGDKLGGAEAVAWNLFLDYRRRGLGSWLGVGRKRSVYENVVRIPNHLASGRWSRFWWKLHARLQPHYGRTPGVRHLCRGVHSLAEPAGWIDRGRGYEDFRYPGTWKLLDALPERPDVIHCHNLHGRYFDLSALPWLSRQAPLFVTLHDAWMLSGHCAHSFDCERWVTGCGQCPDLTIYPALAADGTAENWRRKQRIYSETRLRIATPSRWLMDKVERSMLAEAIVDARVIPYGIDLGTFRPDTRQEVRESLNIAPNARVLLFAANGIRANPFKDYRTLCEAVRRAAVGRRGEPVLFVALGEGAAGEDLGDARVRFVPFQNDAARVARYYQAADIYVHAARADTFPNTVLEALGCGTPVVATAVGGIGEQVRSLAFGKSTGTERSYGPDHATGILVGEGDAVSMAAAIGRLLDDDALLKQMSRNAASDAHRRFDLSRQADDYLAWYREALTPQVSNRSWKAREVPRSGAPEQSHPIMAAS